MEERIILLHPKKARLRAQLINDTLPGILLLINGLDAVMNPVAGQQWLPYLNIAAGTALVIAVIRELKGKNIRHTIVRWFDILAGIVLILEGANHYHSYKIIQPADGYFLIGVVTIVRGLFHSKMPHVRRMVLSSEGIHARFSPFRRIRFSKNDITSMQIEQSQIRIQTHNNGEQLIRLRRIENANEVKSALTQYAVDYGIEIHAA